MEHMERACLTKISESPRAGLPLIGFDIETYSLNGFPAYRQDPIVAATLAVSPSPNLNHGLILVSLLFPPSMESMLLSLLQDLLSPSHGGSLVTYNGKRFDQLYTVHRGFLHGLDLEQTFENYGHLDMYEIVRSTLPMLPSYGQKSVEHLLGVRRLVKDICGANYHQAFESFLMTGDLNPLFYNIEDSIGCLRILNHLTTKNFKDEGNY